MAPRPPTILHLITALPVGGAQTVLRHVARGAAEHGFATRVVSLTDTGAVGERLRSDGIAVEALGMRPSVPDPRALARLVRLLRRHRPAVVQSWMYHADLLAALARPFVPPSAFAWNIRQSNLDPVHSKRATIWTARLCARLSHRAPDRIVCCSEAARRVHAGLGYDTRRMLVIQNGVDLRQFAPDPAAGARLRLELGLSADTPVVGYAARWDPQKDHACFVRAAARLARERPDVVFVLCGEGIDPANAELARWIGEARLSARVKLLGRRDDMPAMYQVFDVGTSSSAYGEGFPNALAEALACGVPCVTTDVGDSVDIVGPAGAVFPIGDDAALAAAWRTILALPPEERAALRATVRRRIVERFDVRDMVRRYHALYAELVARRNGPEPAAN